MNETDSAFLVHSCFGMLCGFGPLREHHVQISLIWIIF